MKNLEENNTIYYGYISFGYIGKFKIISKYPNPENGGDYVIQCMTTGKYHEVSYYELNKFYTLDYDFEGIDESMILHNRMYVIEYHIDNNVIEGVGLFDGDQVIMIEPTGYRQNLAIEQCAFIHLANL